VSDQELQRGLGRVEGKLDQVLQHLEAHFEDDKERFASLDGRLAKVEKKVWYASGVGSLLGALLTLFVNSR
jgi:hypothetical protein